MTPDVVWHYDEHFIDLTFQCAICGYSETHNAPFMDSDFAIENQPTCTQPGGGHYTVNYFGTYFISDYIEIPATGHHYSEPTWSWAEDYSSATAEFNCVEGDHTEYVTTYDIDEVYQYDSITYTANVDFNGESYTDTEFAFRDYFAGHSLTLEGNIGVNYFINITDEEYNNGATVEFSWDVEGDLKTCTVTKDDIKKVGKNLYKATCYVAAAEMTYNINTDLYLGESLISTNVYSVKQYADYILTNQTFIASYIASENARGKDGEERYNRLKELVQTMLDYGARAQIRFDRNTDVLANGGTYFYDDTTSPVNAEEIDAPSSDMRLNLSDYGLSYVGSTIVYLSATTLRHYYKIEDSETFGAYSDSIYLDGVKAEYSSRDGMIYFEFTNIEAFNLDKQHTITIGSTSYSYSALSYIKKLISSSNPESYIELGKATVRYHNAAKSYFNG